MFESFWRRWGAAGAVWLTLYGCATDEPTPIDTTPVCAAWESYDDAIGRCVRRDAMRPDMPVGFPIDMPPPQDMDPPPPPPQDMPPAPVEDETPDVPPVEDMGPPEMTIMPDMSEPDCPAQPGRYGDPCACADQCANRLCLGNPINGQGTCTQTCGSRLQCDGGQDQCIDLGGTKVCVRDDTGAPCAGGPHLCSVQLCVQATSATSRQQTFCSALCDSAADCLPNHVCSPAVCKDVSGDPNLPLRSCILTLVPFLSEQREALLAEYPTTARLCVPVLQPNPCQSDADAGLCMTGLCDDSPAVCSGQCLIQQDCPQGQCTAFDTSDARVPLGFCEF